MFSKTFLRIAVLLLSLNVLFSCKKEPENITPQHESGSVRFENGFDRYSWSEKEVAFFDLNSYQKFQVSSSLDSRNEENGSLIYHPDLVRLYNEIAEQNEIHNFIEGIVNKAGYPVWRHARIVEDHETEKVHILLPLAFDTHPAVTALITAIKEENGFVINAISRQELLDTENGDPIRNLAYNNALAGYDKLLFGVEGEALEAFCECVDILDQNPYLGPDPALPPDENCNWHFLEFCSDLNTQTNWFGGLSNMPPHLDHDSDGIINYEDQDWLQYGVSQEEFENYVIQWWQVNYEQEYGDYYDFWNEDVWEDFVSVGGGQDFQEFWDDFSDMWDDFWDWLSDDDRFGDDIYYDPGHDDPSRCYFDWPRPGGEGRVEEREVRCLWYYILDCGEEYNANNWWNVLTHIECPECPGYQEHEDLFYARVKEYYDTHEQTFASFTSLDDLVQTAELIGCDAFSPYFEHCINEALLVSVFGLGYTNIFTAEAINWLTVTPPYPEGPERVYWIANYWKGEGYSEEAKDRIREVVNWVGALQGFDPDREQLLWLFGHPAEFEVTRDFSAEFSGDAEALLAITWAIQSDLEGVLGLDQLFSPASLQLITQYIDDCCPEGIDDYDGWTDAPEGQYYAEILQDEILILKQKYQNDPLWPDWRIELTARLRLFKDGLHFMLDGCGIIEGLGTPCDIANGFFYAIEGNGTDATLSFAAGLPGGAIINGGRLLKKAVNIGGKTRRFVWREVGGLVGFSHGSSYRTVWKAVYPALDNVDMRAHHVVPKALWDNALVQKAARANPNGLPDGVDPFHMNMPANGWPVHTSRHAGNHQGYSDEILAKLTEWDNLHPDATSEQAATAIAQWQILIKNTIGNSATGPNINNLDLPDIP